MKIERAINILASILTITQFVISIFIWGNFTDNSFSKITQSLALPSKLVLFIILESILAYFFGYLIQQMSYWKDYIKIFSLGIILCFVSSWISLFNIQLIILNEAITKSTPLLDIYIYLLLTLAILIGIIYISLIHWKALAKAFALLQAGSFLLLLSALRKYIEN